MFIHTPGKHLHILVSGDRPPLKAGQELIGLIDKVPAHSAAATGSSAGPKGER